MKVRQCIIEKTGPGDYAIIARVELTCELIGSADDEYVHVRLLEAGAGLPAGAEITVPSTEVILD